MRKFLLLGVFVTILLHKGYTQGSFDIFPLSSDGWTTLGNGITITEENSIKTQGSASAAVNVTTATQSNTDMRTSMDVVSGTEYTVSFDIYHTEGKLKARLYANNNYRNYSTNSITNSWQTLTYTFTATSTESILVGLRFYDQSGFDGAEVVYVDNLTINGSVLPIDLTSFTATPRANQVSLSWETAAEINNDYFTIERSTNGQRFEAIGKVAGAGNSATAQNYSFADKTPMRGTNYYRLAQTDYDGQSETFDVVSVDFKGSVTTTIRPTQVKDMMTLSLEPMESVGRVTIFNLLGQKMYDAPIQAGTSLMEIDASSFTRGQYFAHVASGQFMETVQFSKL